MPKVIFTGSLRDKIKSLNTLNRIAIGTYVRHAFGRKMAADWDANTEIGIRFIRHQFTTAMRHGDMARGRAIFDSVQLETDDHYDVITSPSDIPKGTWYRPKVLKTNAILLYFHGGGYAFHGGVSRRFAAMLAHRIGAPLFAPAYRMTPEHSHPAQSEDAMAAWTMVRRLVPDSQIVVIGDSAGGHMALMLLLGLKDASQDQPALCVGLCPWTDIGDRGASLTENDRYDLVQGWMALLFGEWLDPHRRFGRDELSPIAHNFKGLAPIYLQAGGREVLRDMIVDFANVQKAHGADVTLDIWADMPHVFQAYDSTKTSSVEALERISERIDMAINEPN